MGTLAVDRKDAIRKEISDAFGCVPKWTEGLPDEVLDGFWSTMRDFQLGETAIPNKYKELIGLGVAGATRCRYCALFHTEAARLFGATDQEISEAAAMAAHTMMASTFLNAMQVDYAEFKKELTGIVDYIKHLPQKGHASGVLQGDEYAPSARSQGGVAH